MKRFNEAIDAYRQAVALNSNYVDGWANLGTALHHNGVYAEAMATLRAPSRLRRTMPMPIPA